MEYFAGSIQSAPGSGPFENALSSDWADMVDGFQKSALESRLGIPLIYGIDAVHDGDLARRIGAATALEVRATGIHYTFAPCIAVCKDPRWGRCYESYGEDTDIVRKMTPIVSGLQGEPPKGHHHLITFFSTSSVIIQICFKNNIIACAKHFVGDGGVCTVMASYSSWNGSKLHGDHFLLTEVLKNKLGFKGFLISDWEGIDELTIPYGSNYRQCISTVVNAGIDMVMVPHRFKQFVDDLTFLVESGEVPMSRIDDAVKRILRVKFLAGVFGYPFCDRSLLDIVGCKLHRELAREAVCKSLVLLKNGKNPKKPFLPLDRNSRRILVTGTHANDLGYQCGGWTKTKYGHSGGITIGTTILEAIKEAVGDKTEVIYEQYPSPHTLERQDFSFAIVAFGEEPYAENGGDNAELVIPIKGSEVINSVAERIPTLAILISGRPLTAEPQLLEKLEVFVAAWLPGSEGRGIADVIFGDYDFTGQLPVTWMGQ
ncbi:hypothetical protein Patl1_31150 [Pistacia atlantica]|uniref:Uncharacterized protein n=1 Tax=Pistacia atlantica TaxID=434234 RepID=A0ACC1AAW4_9ROSI|nr:hypothetical protein Patl1_31150 [Pistacia atlantica]